MQVTKYEHAALVLDEGGRRLVIDPGGFTRSLGDVSAVDGIVITHEHPDHWTPAQLAALVAANPSARVFGPAGVAAAVAAADLGIDVDVVADGDTRAVGPFSLRFAGTHHALIHSSIPIIDNTGVLVNGTLFHPGDSYTLPPVGGVVLAAPVGAPWLKISEAMDYVAAASPSKLFPIHEWTLSPTGLGMHLDRLRSMVEPAGAEVVTLAPGDTLDV
ncbi:MBL fold metallo-hydrolase [Frondihabitans australicus]|uniref:L-ascorbate metabolism protein UlaG (Beta-lactamase superfamily) n=1 Tax=Frondihabitans australicus TaxID=386892 RepID=A0A495IEQ8_9MICO|nr:MBL fold metallo-hydrolase [Frondihabitans australicus]RKR73635.1 L-ascorbate metabolism protein UlaG (beta-lactamase superfamily) [Frondihabitans australicus]